MQPTDEIKKIATAFLVIFAAGLLAGVVISQLVAYPILAVVCFSVVFMLTLFLIDLILS